MEKKQKKQKMSFFKKNSVVYIHVSTNSCSFSLIIHGTIIYKVYLQKLKSPFHTVCTFIPKFIDCLYVCVGLSIKLQNGAGSEGLSP